MELNTEIQAAQVILEKGSRFEVPAPFFYRLIGKKKLVLHLHMPTASTCLKVVDMRLKMGITDEQFEVMTVEQGLSMLNQHGMTVAKIVSTVILDGERTFGKRKIRLTVYQLAKLLLKYYPFSFLLQKMHEITLGSGLEDFTLTIGLLKTMRLMKPNNPSHQAQRS